jgi:hypothetical protein
MAQGLFRLRTVDGAMRLEQIGMSWVFHGFAPLAGSAVCGSCTGADPNHLGIGCTSSDTALSTGSQSGLGPRWQVNPNTGALVFPHANPPFSGTTARRLQPRLDELDTTSAYFVEVLCVAADDAAAGNIGNNVTYRQCTISGGPAEYTMSLMPTQYVGVSALDAWRRADMLLLQEGMQAPGDGWFLASSRATPVAPGRWRYEYAVYNFNAHTGGQSFSVPLPDYATLTNVGFHDVDYRDGDGEGGVTRDGTDWRATRVTGAMVWETTPYSIDPNANALLWGTLYNFRFDADVPPRVGPMTLGTWRTAGSLIGSAWVPSDCYANCDNSTASPVLNVNDFICFQTRYAAGDARANCDGSTTGPVLSVNDFVCFMSRFAAGCT